MSKNLLTVLGCSGSIVLTLGMGETVSANNRSVVRELVFTASDAPKTLVEEEFNCFCTGENGEGDFLNDDGLGDAAIAQYGCDCAGCRLMVRERMQAEKQPEKSVIQ